MKSTLLFLISFLTCQTLFAQGISVQGIARNAEKAALVDEQMTFTFEIVGENGTTYYVEDEEIRTDPYGVFSHIIGTGVKDPSSKEFTEIPFGQTHMKLVISADGEVISNELFQYVPYAHHAKTAENGVPTGTIVAFLGKVEDVPKGWVFCDGRDLNDIEGSENLIDLIGSFAPDLQGMFLRGTGKTANDQSGPKLGEVQEDTIKTHRVFGKTKSDGSHTHAMYFDTGEGGGDGAYMAKLGDGSSEKVWAGANFTVRTGSDGVHDHDIDIQVNGANETRPVNYGVNYIIKL